LHGRRFNIVSTEPPLKLSRFRLNIVVPKVVMKDAGLAWLVGLLKRAGDAEPRRRRGQKPEC
jgi:hypothetical protein